MRGCPGTVHDPHPSPLPSQGEGAKGKLHGPADTLTSPDLITQDVVDPQRLVYYRTYQAQPQRWLKVVVEQGEVVTAYRVRHLKQGETTQWQR